MILSERFNLFSTRRNYKTFMAKQTVMAVNSLPTIVILKPI